MSLKTILFTLILFSTISYNGFSQKEMGEVTVEVQGIRNTDGYLLISLFNKSIGYPEDEKKAYRNKKVKVEKGTEEVVFKELPNGDYAIVFLHDEDDNQKMNKNMVGMPQEGYGASNNAVNNFSAPKFSEAKFKLAQKQVKQSLKVYY